MKQRHVKSFNSWIVNEQAGASSKYEKEGYNCEQHATHTVCSRKDKYGFVVRVFANESMGEYKDRLPEKAVFQAGGQDWPSTLSAFRDNNAKVLPNTKLPDPTEPTEMTEVRF